MTRDAPRLLLLSNSSTHGRPYLSHALEAVSAHLDGCDSVLFVPYALNDHAAYTASVAAALEPLGVEVSGLHTFDDPVAAVGRFDAVFVGGGNTFRLLRRLRQAGLLGPLRAKAESGMPYVGSSAGTNVACPTIKTTNDMPIVDPQGFDALGLIPFQINPHYLDADPSSTHQGETRAQRLTEFCEESGLPVLAMREGSWLTVYGDEATLGGANGGLIFGRDHAPDPVGAHADLSWLLREARDVGV